MTEQSSQNGPSGQYLPEYCREVTRFRELVSCALTAPDSRTVEVIIDIAEAQLNHNPLILQFPDASAIFSAFGEVKG